MDHRLRLHPLGLLELAETPREKSLDIYCSDENQQTEGGSYQADYSDAHLNAIRRRIVQRRTQASDLMGFDGRTLLDVGRGVGFALASFAEVGWAVSGIDHSRIGIESMDPKVAHNFENGDLFTLISSRPRRGANYDLLWLGNVLEHVSDPVGILESLRRLVAPGGCLPVIVPKDVSAYREFLSRHRVIPERVRIAVPDRINCFISESLIAIATATKWGVDDWQGDFPIDVFLPHPDSNDVVDCGKGPAARAPQIWLEACIGAAGAPSANRFHSALAGVGLARDLTACPIPKAVCDPKGA